MRSGVIINSPNATVCLRESNIQFFSLCLYLLNLDNLIFVLIIYTETGNQVKDAVSKTE